MAQRLYRDDSYLTTFTARVVACRPYGETTALILDQTAFYPASGGQPNDEGTLAGLRVCNVVERDDGEILHIVAPEPSSPLPAVGDVVEGTIAWARRFDHMQQHSGQHVLSQAFVRVADLDTIAIHIGASESTLDLPVPTVPPDVVERVEREANAIVAEDRPIRAYEVHEADLSAVPLRRPPKVSGVVRIVEVQAYDWSACGGTHVRNTAQIGPIKIIKTEKRGAETRITFLCGRRALEDYARLSATIGHLMEALSAGRYEVEPAVRRLIATARADHKALRDAQARLAAYEAAEMIAQAQPLPGGGRLVARAFDARDPGDLRTLVKQLTATPGIVVLLGAAGDKSQLIFARAKGGAGDLAAALKPALAVLSPQGDARGGGSAEAAQGGGIPADLARVRAAIEAARDALLAQLCATSVSADKS